MRPFSLMVLASFALYACGGGSGVEAPSIIPQSPNAYTYAYSGKSIYSDTDTSYTVTSTDTDVDDAGHRLVTQTRSDDSTYKVFDMGTLDHAIFPIGTVYFRGGCSYTSLPNFPAPPFTEGQSWSLTYGEKCTDRGFTTVNTVDNYTSKGTVTAIEDVKTEAGTFSSYKIETTDTVSGMVTYTGTQWVSRELNIVVRSQISWVKKLDSNTFTQGSETKDLIGVSSVNFKGSNYPVSRFAGRWTLSSLSSSCAMVVSSSGALSGTCPLRGSNPSSVSLSGQVDNHGNITASASDRNTFTGSLTSPLKGQGQWVAPGTFNTVEAWTASHQ